MHGSTRNYKWVWNDHGNTVLPEIVWLYTMLISSLGGKRWSDREHKSSPAMHVPVSSCWYRTRQVRKQILSWFLGDFMPQRHVSYFTYGYQFATIGTRGDFMVLPHWSDTMTHYPTQSHYPETELTTPCLFLINVDSGARCRIVSILWVIRFHLAGIWSPTFLQRKPSFLALRFVCCFMS